MSDGYYDPFGNGNGQNNGGNNGHTPGQNGYGNDDGRGDFYGPDYFSRGYGNGGYGAGYNPYGQPPMRLPGHGFALASLIFGILAMFSPIYLAVFSGVCAIVFSCISRARSKRFEGMAVAGLVLGIIGLIFGVVSAVLYFTGALDRLLAYLESSLNGTRIGEVTAYIKGFFK